MKIEILFEDNENGSVAVKVTPSAEALFEKYKKRLSMSPAECMALICLSAAINSDANAPVIEALQGKNKIIV